MAAKWKMQIIRPHSDFLVITVRPVFSLGHLSVTKHDSKQYNLIPVPLGQVGPIAHVVLSCPCKTFVSRNECRKFFS